jgi:uncharacterized protein (TIRG00374 family)
MKFLMDFNITNFHKMLEKINWRIVFKIMPFIGIILFIFIIYNIGINNIINSFSKIPIIYFLPASLLLVPRVLLFSVKWKYICDKQKFNLKYFYLAKVFLITFFYSCVTPGGIGYHIRIYYLRKKSNSSIEKCLANSMIDSQIGFLAGIFLGLIGSLFVLNFAPQIFPIVLIFFTFNLLTFYILIKKKKGRVLVNFFIRPFIPQKYKSNFDNSIDLIYKDMPSFRDMIWPFILELGVWFIAGTQLYVISLSFNLNIPFYVIILCSITAVIFTAIIPISIGGLGVREGIFVILMSGFGVEYDVAIVISLAGFIVKIVIPSIIGLIISFFIKDYKISD